jgi:hypothetical protein
MSRFVSGLFSREICSTEGVPRGGRVCYLPGDSGMLIAVISQLGRGASKTQEHNSHGGSSLRKF